MADAAAAFEGRNCEGIARVAEAPPRAMVTLRGDLGQKTLRATVTGATGLAFPGQGAAVVDGEAALLSMSPDEILMLLPRDGLSERLEAARKALAGTHHLLADVSDARAIFRVTGDGAREVLAKLTPADVSPAAFKPGMVRRSRLAQVPAAFWLGAPQSGAECFEVIAFRSVADYVFDLLCSAARPGGEVGYF